MNALGIKFYTKCFEMLFFLNENVLSIFVLNVLGTSFD